MKGCVKPWIVFRILAKLFRKPCCYLCPFIFLQWTNMSIFQCPSFYEAYIQFSWFSLTSIYINIAYGYKLKSKKVKKKSLHIGCQQVGSMLVQRLSLTSIYINISYWYKLKSKKVKKKLLHIANKLVHTADLKSRHITQHVNEGFGKRVPTTMIQLLKEKKKTGKLEQIHSNLKSHHRLPPPPLTAGLHIQRLHLLKTQ